MRKLDILKEHYRARRLKGRIRITEIALAIGCTVGQISNWENDRGYMSKERIMMYMDYIDTEGKVGI